MYLTPEIRAVVAAMAASTDQERVITEVLFNGRPVAAVASEIGRSDRICRYWIAAARHKLRELAERDDLDLRALVKHPDERESLPQDPDDAL